MRADRKPGRGRARAAAIAVAAILAVCGMPAAASARTAPLIAAAGDIACTPPNPDYNNGIGTSSDCQQLATSNLLSGREWSAVLPLGDLTYDDGASLSGYQASYEPTWGRWKIISHPVIGNHEYDDHLGAQGYWDYWNGFGNGQGRAGTRGRGWYSYNLGSWHLIALNSNCRRISCRYNGRQVKWLRGDLERHADQCVLAYFHHPRFSSGAFEERLNSISFWRALYRGGADVILNGHEHVYERFAPQTPAGTLDGKRGIVQFTVGTGGYFLFPFVEPAPNSIFRWNASFGVLAMRLYSDRFAWSFLTLPNGDSVDSGSRRCTREQPEPLRSHGHQG